jgi:hypothetical protein
MRQECPCARAVAALPSSVFPDPLRLVAISSFSACDAISWPSYVPRSRGSCVEPGPKARKDGTHCVCALEAYSTWHRELIFENASLAYNTNGV